MWPVSIAVVWWKRKAVLLGHGNSWMVAPPRSLYIHLSILVWIYAKDIFLSLYWYLYICFIYNEKKRTSRVYKRYAAMIYLPVLVHNACLDSTCFLIYAKLLRARWPPVEIYLFGSVCTHISHIILCSVYTI